VGETVATSGNPRHRSLPDYHGRDHAEIGQILISGVYPTQKHGDGI
jgi:hypothetical protein